MLSDSVLAMLQSHKSDSLEDIENGLKEVMQELALLGMYRAGFFNHGLFYGGSALRLLYGLDRYSEDLDFSLLKPDASFSIGKYKLNLEKELLSHGFEVEFQEKIKVQQSPISSAFLKANTLKHIIKVHSPHKTHKEAKIKIKLEVDRDPPLGFATEVKFRLSPIPYSVRTMTQPSLFSGKISAMLCRDYIHNVKGRDWYDFVWYVGRKTPINIHHLEQRMLQTGHLKKTGLTKENIKTLLKDKLHSINLTLARDDVIRFIKDKQLLDLWSTEFFDSVIEQLQFIDKEN